MIEVEEDVKHIEIPEPKTSPSESATGASFTLSAEILPPTEQHSAQEVFEQCADLVKQGFNFLSVADGPAGTPRGGTLETSKAIQSRLHVPAVPHLICRDSSPEDIARRADAFHEAGIRSILALRGDPPSGDRDWFAGRNGSYKYALQLVEQLRAHEAGFRIGIGAYPDAGFDGKNVARESADSDAAATDADATSVALDSANLADRAKSLEVFRMKVSAGAQFAISQMILSADSYAKFLDEIEKLGCVIPVYAGVLIPKSRAHASELSEKFGVEVSGKLLASLAANENDPSAESARTETLTEFVSDLKSAGAPGIHYFLLRSRLSVTHTLR